MLLRALIKRLKMNAFLLFLIPSLAIIGSLLINNYLIAFKFQKATKIYNHITDVPGDEYNINCDESNNGCISENSYTLHKDLIFLFSQTTKKLDNCFAHTLVTRFSVNGNEMHASVYRSSKFFNISNNNQTWKLKKEYLNANIKLINYIVEKKNKLCIKNSQGYYFFYNYFPPFKFILNQTANLIDNGISLGTSTKINPFLYGEVSISNLVKRYPINIFFKSFLYIGVILMLTYWHSYNKIFKLVINKKVNMFYFLGIGSAICLLFHVFFLGTTLNNEILKDFRRIVLVLFILFEILAQTLLAIKIYYNKETFLEYTYNSIVWAKIIFVSIIVFSTIVIVTLLTTYNFPKNVDYILEWNYFIVLLIFYLLSSLLWKKNN